MIQVLASGEIKISYCLSFLAIFRVVRSAKTVTNSFVSLCPACDTSTRNLKHLTIF